MKNSEAVKSIVVSPSGKLYGSEKVLIDYLNATKNVYEVYLPSNSPFFKDRNTLVQKKHNYKVFSSVTKLYFIITLKLIFLKTYKNVYLNEGGHIKWIALLAKIFKNHNFYVHIRLIEDANPHRLISVDQLHNLKLISISSYIHQTLPIDSIELPDPFPFNGDIKRLIPKETTFSIVGRVADTKGFYEAFTFISYALKQNMNIRFYFYGDVEQNVLNSKEYKTLLSKYPQNVIFKGYATNQEEIYSGKTAIIHFNKSEPLGRIFLEAINRQKFLFGINGGGIAEIAKVCGLSNYLVNDNELWIQNMYEKITDKQLLSNYKLLELAKEKAKLKFELAAYANFIDDLLK